MTRISASLGGVPPGGQPEQWRQSQYQRQQAVDWNSPEHASPQPAPGHKYRKYQLPVTDIPQLPERKIRVRAIAPRSYYTLEGVPIPNEQWVTVPISPSLMAAIKAGDLERGPDPDDEAPAAAATPEPQQGRRHRTQVTPPHQAE